MKRRMKSYSGTTGTKTSQREIEHRGIACRAAAEGFVLLQNNGVLPIDTKTGIGLFGPGSLHFVKGGTGSGDVNPRDVVSAYEGMKTAGYTLYNEEWLHDYETAYQAARLEWKQYVLDHRNMELPLFMQTLDSYVKHPFRPPLGRSLNKAEAAPAAEAVAVYFLCRVAGEGADRKPVKGDYYITDEELAQMLELKAAHKQFVLLLNVGAPIDLGFLEQVRPDAVLLISQPGIAGGTAIAQSIKGDAPPSGKLTATWAMRYNDYPGAQTFSHMNGNLDQELYSEGIYVGYRYFDAMNIQPRFPFGFGLSYTDFQMHCRSAALIDDGSGDPAISLQISVANTGACYAGKQVVQIYASCPQDELEKEYQRLCAFYKTPLLVPGETSRTTVAFPVRELASFSEERSAYILEAGTYLIAAGDSSANNEVVCTLVLDQTVELYKVDAVCPLQKSLHTVHPQFYPKPYTDVQELCVSADAFVCKRAAYHTPPPSDEALDFVQNLSEEQLIALTSGDPSRSPFTDNPFGSGGCSVPGSAGETHTCAQNPPHNLAAIVMADGPAGLRLQKEYQVSPDGEVMQESFIGQIENGFFSESGAIDDAQIYHQYCTAFPIGTLLAQSFNTELLYAVGQAVGAEMEEFGISLWLAPGMNIQRNPLCGRNYEYFSEDPFLTGVLAAAITKGVQSRSGVGVTIKHFACNNLENNRMHSDSVVSQRALREIYLRGFEIAVRTAQPMALMTSYNLINGIYAANSTDLIQKVLRNEWGFRGMVMTDWTVTTQGGASPVECMRAGNDLIMPGSFSDTEQIQAALLDGSLPWQAVQHCIARLVNTIWQTLEYEDAAPYSAQFGHLRQVMKIKQTAHMPDVEFRSCK